MGGTVPRSRQIDARNFEITIKSYHSIDRRERFTSSTGINLSSFCEHAAWWWVGLVILIFVFVR